MFHALGDEMKGGGAYRHVQCRTCVAVAQLPFGSDVEIECTAYLNAPSAKL